VAAILAFVLIASKHARKSSASIDVLSCLILVPRLSHRVLRRVNRYRLIVYGDILDCLTIFEKNISLKRPPATADGSDRATIRAKPNTNYFQTAQNVGEPFARA